MKSTGQKVAQALGAAVVATLMVFTGLAVGTTAPAGADCGSIGGGSYGHYNSDMWDLCYPPPKGLKASRYSSTAGEIMWHRSSGAIGYNVTRSDGKNYGFMDALSLYMTDLDPGRRYTFTVAAVYGSKEKVSRPSVVTIYG